MESLISVIVPVYNVEPYLRQCVDSILAQTYQNLEIILVDDGSTDNSPAICDEYARKDTHIRVIHKKNGGQADARNVGLSIAKGQWIGFVDSDDFIEPEMYEEMLEAGMRENAEIVCCGRYIYSDKEQRAEHCVDRIRIFSPEQAVAGLLLNNALGVSIWDKLYRNELFAEIRFPVGEENEDLPVTIKLLGMSKKTVHIGKPFYYYRIRTDSLSKSPYSPQKGIVIDHMHFVSQYIGDYFPELSRENACFQARYAAAMMAKILMLPSAEERKKYQADYRAYQSILRCNYLKALQNKSFAKKYKVKGALVLLGIYRPVTKLRIALRGKRK